MCGIFGYFARSGDRLTRNDLDLMGQMIHHRGPDEAGVFEADHAAVGNQRLSIIDVEHGHQPFVSDDGNIAVVQNGEIFNYLELADELARRGNPCRTHSDTEVILRLYELEGMSLLSRLNGMFAIAVLDRRRDTLCLARDRLGVKPLYFHDSGARVLFASEIKSLLAGGVRPLLEPRSVHSFLAYNYVPPPDTLFTGVRHVKPGTWLEISAKGLREHRWWTLLDHVAIEDRAEREWAERILDLLTDSVRLRMRSDVPFGAFLSGGIDSSAVVGLMARLAERVRTFSIGFDEPSFDESQFAQMAAKRFGTDHTCQVVSPDMLELWPLVTYHCDQAHGDVSFMPTYRLSELAARNVKVVLTGDGGDELFAGYEKYAGFFTSGNHVMSDQEFVNAYTRHISLFPNDVLEDLLTPEFRAEIQGHDPWAPVKDIVETTQGVDRINQTLLIDTLFLLPGNNLVKPDRMGMAVSLEARTPFLDYRLVETAFRIPGALKLRGRTTKYILKKALEPLLGPELTHRRKQMFTVPIGEWLKHSGDAMRALLLGPAARERGLFEPRIVEAMIEAHVTHRRNYTRELRALIALELWFRQFIDQQVSMSAGECWTAFYIGSMQECRRERR